MTPQPPQPAPPRHGLLAAVAAVAVAVALPLVATGCAAVEKTRSTIANHTTGSESGLTAADGYIPDGQSVSPFADVPAITGLDPNLRSAVQRAATDAAADGVQLVINSGWRSKRLQQSLLDQAVQTYGSKEEARKWVSTPEKSSHVVGKAVDAGPTDADSWLSQHGSDYGLCQTYANEMWHYELAVAPGGTCPRQITDAAAG